MGHEGEGALHHSKAVIDHSFAVMQVGAREGEGAPQLLAPTYRAVLCPSPSREGEGHSTARQDVLQHSRAVIDHFCLQK